MTEQLTEDGRRWASEHEEDSVVANVALHGRGEWPDAFVSASIAVANEQGERLPKGLLRL